MERLSINASDEEMIALVDRWAALLESEDYAAAYAYTEHDPARGWTPELMRSVIKAYGEERSTQTVTLEGDPTDIVQRKDVSRRENPERPESVGDIWYDLNIDGFVSDLTATFEVVRSQDRLTVVLEDIHVM